MAGRSVIALRRTDCYQSIGDTFVQLFRPRRFSFNGFVTTDESRHLNQAQDMTNAARIRILSVDDHPLFREGIGAIINCQLDMSLVGAASKGAERLKDFARCSRILP